jgi:hypothetical protein
MIRDDLSNRLIHLTKGGGNEPFSNLLSILREKALHGGSGYIKGGHTCVCFSETPISKIGLIIANRHKDFKYKPYGLMFHKKWVFARGGLPVIYQPDADYDDLPEKKKHLHVRFDLNDKDTIDFSWEREWRVPTNSLEFSPDDVSVIVPTRDVVEGLRTGGLDKCWHLVVLEDLGVEVHHGLVFGE